ncbi:bifunctional phosphoglucose/phosphomannose isomerase [Metallosphaera hakonensis JCM 8857 = DSM 7519]|uniref:Bifunctional phosphoglucose/phosphomannose isomerase n=2 Tax=Metallosphaera hakonensis TaxID=79601 RepID=A0A2U9IUU7_9CREN|nr:bifunctional phosphoglucose/phosphomannose isomerase [Metallosphaera hakonensis JCM 8857 = DSM 7519]
MYREDVEVPQVDGEVSCFGMGGSGVACEVMRAFFDFSDVKHSNTLIALSYSGDTVETLVKVREALSLGKRVIVITSGGKLAELNVEKIKIKGGAQPRYAFPRLFLPLVKMLRPDLVSDVVQGVDSDRARAVSADLLNYVRGRIPVFYASRYLGVAKRFKQEINENAKSPAFFGEIPEVNHNEVEGYVRGGSLAPVVFSSTQVDDITASLINAKVIRVEGMKDVSFLIQVAGFLSVALAKEVGEDPARLTNIPEGRRRMGFMESRA